MRHWLLLVAFLLASQITGAPAPLARREAPPGTTPTVAYQLDWHGCEWGVLLRGDGSYSATREGSQPWAGTWKRERTPEGWEYAVQEWPEGGLGVVRWKAIETRPGRLALAR